MSRKASPYTAENIKKLTALCEREGYEIERKSPDQYRVYAAAHIIDIWPARMVYHIIGGEVVKANEPYRRGLDWQFNEEQVAKLLATGDYV